jgi:hypothetical protein
MIIGLIGLIELITFNPKSTSVVRVSELTLPPSTQSTEPNL